jgi:Flp pilus assembly protein TadG
MRFAGCVVRVEKRMKVSKGESGQATVFIVVFLGILMCALLALAVDVGYLFHQKRMAQAAADAAALAAVEEVASGNSLSSSAVTNAANAAATANGFNTGAATNPAVVTLTSLSSGNYPSTAATPPANWVQASVKMPIKTFFLAGFYPALSNMSVTASAVAAGGVPSHTCTCLTGTTGTDLNMSGAATFNMNGCGMVANSSSNDAIVMSGSPSLCGTSIGAVATDWDTPANIPAWVNLCSTASIKQGASACSTPSIVVPTMPTGLTCNANPIQGYVLGPNPLYPSQSYGGNYMLPMNGAVKSSYPTNTPIANDIVSNGNVCYTSLDLTNASSVTFATGYTYFIQGAFVAGSGEQLVQNSAQGYGSSPGIQFVLLAGSSTTITFNGAASTVLTAPLASDGNPGVLFYVPNGATVSVSGGANPTLNGIMYAPNSAINLSGGTTTNLDMDIVANTLTMSGSAGLNNYATVLINGNSGGGGVGVPVLVQ